MKIHIKTKSQSFSLWSIKSSNGSFVFSRSIRSMRRKSELGWELFVIRPFIWLNFSAGNDWYSTLEGFDGLMETRNTRNNISLLHTEFEAFIWVMESMKNLRQFHVTFAINCSQLVKIILGTRRITFFCILSWSDLTDQGKFSHFRDHTYISPAFQTQNTSADSLARGTCN